MTPTDSVEEPLVQHVDVGLKEDGRCQLAAFHLDKLLDRGLIDSYARARRSRCRVARAKYYEPSNREIGVTIQSGDMT